MSDNGRSAPHDLRAEASLLGAMLLAPHAREAAVAAGVTGGDFYKPAHGHIYDAVVELHRASEAVDPVTVSALLERRQLLEAIGGPATLVTLQAGTPSTTTAGAYAAIVVGHAATRRLMGQLGELLEAGYNGADAASLLESARERIDAVRPAGESTLRWTDVDAILSNGLAPTIDPDFLRCTNDQALLYAGRIHVFQGEPGSAKTFLALTAAVEVMALGGTAVYVDLEDTDVGILGRAVALGATGEQLRHQFALVRPDGPLTEIELADIEARAAALNPDLVIIDSVTESLANDEIDENDNIAVARWLKQVPKRLADRTRAAVVLLDHVSKSKEERGRWARGAGAKLGAVDGATYELRLVEPFSRDHAGHIRLVISKDRPGAVGPQGATAANYYIDPSAHGAVVRTRLDPPTADEAAGLPTFVMGQVSQWLEQRETATDKELHAALGRLGAQNLQRALAELLGKGHVREFRDDSNRRARCYRHWSPYPPRETAGGAPAGDLFDPDSGPVEEF